MSDNNIQRNQANNFMDSSTRDLTASSFYIDRGTLTSSTRNDKISTTPKLVGASKEPESFPDEGQPPEKEWDQQLDYHSRLSIEEVLKSLDEKLNNLVGTKEECEYELEQLNCKNLIAKEEYEKTKEEDEIRRQIWRLYEIVGWQDKEIETARRNWSRTKEGRVDGEIKAKILYKQEILPEKNDKEFFERTSQQMRMETEAAVAEARSRMDQLEALGGQIRELEKQAKMLQIQKELLISKRQEKQAEIQFEKLQLEEYYEGVTQAATNWLTEENGLKERRRHAEKMYKVYRGRMKNDYGFKIDL